MILNNLLNFYFFPPLDVNSISHRKFLKITACNFQSNSFLKHKLSSNSYLYLFVGLKEYYNFYLDSSLRKFDSRRSHIPKYSWYFSSNFISSKLNQDNFSFFKDRFVLNLKVSNRSHSKQLILFSLSRFLVSLNNRKLLKVLYLVFYKDNLDFSVLFNYYAYKKAKKNSGFLVNFLGLSSLFFRRRFRFREISFININVFKNLYFYDSLKLQFFYFLKFLQLGFVDQQLFCKFSNGVLVLKNFIKIKKFLRIFLFLSFNTFKVSKGVIRKKLIIFYFLMVYSFLKIRRMFTKIFDIFFKFYSFLGKCVTVPVYFLLNFTNFIYLSPYYYFVRRVYDFQEGILSLSLLKDKSYFFYRKLARSLVSGSTKYVLLSNQRLLSVLKIITKHLISSDYFPRINLTFKSLILTKLRTLIRSLFSVDILDNSKILHKYGVYFNSMNLRSLLRYLNFFYFLFLRKQKLLNVPSIYRNKEYLFSDKKLNVLVSLKKRIRKIFLNRLILRSFLNKSTYLLLGKRCVTRDTCYFEVKSSYVKQNYTFFIKNKANSFSPRNILFEMVNERKRKKKQLLKLTKNSRKKQKKVGFKNSVKSIIKK